MVCPCVPIGMFLTAVKNKKFKALVTSLILQKCAGTAFKIKHMQPASLRWPSPRSFLFFILVTYKVIAHCPGCVEETVMDTETFLRALGMTPLNSQRRAITCECTGLGCAKEMPTGFPSVLVSRLSCVSGVRYQL